MVRPPGTGVLLRRMANPMAQGQYLINPVSPHFVQPGAAGPSSRSSRTARPRRQATTRAR